VSRFGVVIAGGGPAGTGVLLAALKAGRLDALLERGVCVVERGASLMRGTVGDHAIESDTLADVLLECLDGAARTRLAEVLDAPAVEAVRRHLGGPLPLRDVGDFLATVGDALRRLLEAHPRSRVLCGAEVLVATRSGFSHLAAALCPNVKLVVAAPFWCPYAAAGSTGATGGALSAAPEVVMMPGEGDDKKASGGSGGGGAAAGNVNRTQAMAEETYVKMKAARVRVW
jgi:hypothetical protein